MVQRKPTPEEQLLKLIEDPESGKSSVSGASSKGKKMMKSQSAGAVFPDFSKILSSFSFFLQGMQKKSSAVNDYSVSAIAFDIKTINRLLVFLIAGFVIYLCVDLAVLKANHADFLAQVGTNDPVFPTALDSSKTGVKDLEYYKEAMTQRNPFVSGANSGQQVGPDGGVINAPTIVAGVGAGPVAEALQAVKLVGISWGDEPLAMVEDVQTGRTYFLKRGQEFKGIKVQEVSREKVLVTVDGQEGELF